MRTKSNKFRVAHLEANLNNLLIEHKKEVELKSPYIISVTGDRVVDIKKSLRKAVKESGLNKHIRIKDLRTTACSFWASTGVPMKQAQEWLGHSDIQLTANIYSQIVPSAQQKYLNSISSLLNENKIIQDKVLNFQTK